MTLQDRMAMFEKPGLPMNTPAKVAKKNKFTDRLAVFEGAKPEKQIQQQSPQKNNNTQKPAATFASSSNSYQEKKDSDKPTVYHYEVKANTDNVKPEIVKASPQSQSNSPTNQTPYNKALKPVNAASTPVNANNSVATSVAPNSYKTANANASVVAPQPSTPNAVNGQPKCAGCQKTVYVVEQIMIDDKSFHKACLKCSHCNMVLKLGNYASLEGSYFCKPHFMQLFKLKGNYSEGFGNEPHKNQWRDKSDNNKVGGEKNKEEHDEEVNVKQFNKINLNQQSQASTPPSANEQVKVQEQGQKVEQQEEDNEQDEEEQEQEENETTEEQVDIEEEQEKQSNE